MRPIREAARGWLLLFLGLFLVAFMGVIAATIAPQMLRPGEEVDGSTFTGTRQQAQDFFALFAAVIALGATSIAAGLFILVTGRHSRAFAAAALAIAVLLYAIVMEIKAAAG
jgi:hypothetical protein